MARRLAFPFLEGLGLAVSLSLDAILALVAATTFACSCSEIESKRGATRALDFDPQIDPQNLEERRGATLAQIFQRWFWIFMPEKSSPG